MEHLGSSKKCIVKTTGNLNLEVSEREEYTLRNISRYFSFLLWAQLLPHQQ